MSPNSTVEIRAARFRVAAPWLVAVAMLCANATASRAEVPAKSEKPAVIRIVYSAGTLEGKPLLENVLNTAYQQRALENEFQPDGIRIEWDFYPEKKSRLDAYARGVADFTNMGPVETVTLRAAGLDYKVLMALRRFDADVALVTRPESSIRSAADLKGMRIETYAGSHSHLTLCRLLEKHGLARHDVDLVFVEHPGAIRAGLQSGRTSVRLTLGDEVNADDRRSMSVHDEKPDPMFISFGKLCASGEFERRYPAIVQRVVTTLVRVAAWVSDEKNATHVIQSWATSPDELKRLGRIYGGKGVIKEQMSPLMDRYFQAGLRRDSDDAKRFEIIKPDANTSFDGWLEPKYLTRALQELRLETYWPERAPEGTPRTRPE